MHLSCNEGGYKRKECVEIVAYCIKSVITNIRKNHIFYSLKFITSLNYIKSWKIYCFPIDLVIGIENIKIFITPWDGHLIHIFF